MHAQEDEEEHALSRTSSIHADEVFTLARAEESYGAVVYRLPKAGESDSDWRVVFYRQEGSAYVRRGAERTAVGSEGPRRVSEPGAPPRVESAEKRLGVTYAFVVDAKGADMVPVEAVGDGGLLVGHPGR